MKTIFLVAILFYITNLQAQGLSGIKFVYSHEVRNMHGIPFTYKLYYIIQGSRMNIHGRFYNPLVFSGDSTEITGYVRYDLVEKEMYIVYYDEGHPVITDTNNKEQSFFPFFNDTLNDRGDKIIVHAKNHNSVFVMDIIEDAIPSDVIIIKQLTFF